MRSLLPAAALVLASPAAAEVKSASPNGFEIEQRVQLVVSPESAYRSFARIGSWWDPEHSYSGKASNLSLSLSPGGCFCERLPDGGGVEHMRVASVEPGKRVVMTGALGPLLYEGTSGVMDLRIEPVAGGSRLIVNYRAAGFANGGAEKLAPAVDEMLGEQMKRLRSFAAANDRRSEP